MPNAQQLLAHPRFQSLSRPAQLYALRKADPEFAKLPVSQQIKEIRTYKSPTARVDEQLAAVPAGQITKPELQPISALAAAKKVAVDPWAGPLTDTARQLTPQAGLPVARTAYQRLTGQEPITMIDPETGERARPINKAQEVANFIRGAGQTAGPVIAPMVAASAVAAPAALATEMVGGYALGEGGAKGVELAGGSEGAQDLARVLGGMVPVAGSAGRVLRALRPAPQAAPSLIPKEPLDVAPRPPLQGRAPAGPASPVAPPGSVAGSTEGLFQPRSRYATAAEKEGGIARMAQNVRGLTEKPGVAESKAFKTERPTAPKGAEPQLQLVETPVAEPAVAASAEPVATPPKTKLGSKQSATISWAKARVQSQLGITADEVKSLDPADQRAYFDLVYRLAKEEKGAFDIDALRQRLNPEAQKRVDVLLGRAGRKATNPLERFQEVLAEQKATAPERLLEAETDWFDRTAPVRELVNQAARHLRPEEDPWISIRNYAGHQGKAEAKVRELKEIVMPQAAERPNLETDMLTQRYEELAKQGITRFPGGQTIDDIRATKAEFRKAMTPERLQALRETQEKIYDWENSIIRDGVDAGVLSKEQANATFAKHEHYVPLDRMDYVAQNIDRMPWGKRAFSVAKQDMLKHIEGSEKEVRDIWQSMIDKAYRATALMERNKVAKQIYDLADRPEFGSTVVRIGPGATVPHGMETVNVLVDGVKRQFAVPQMLSKALHGMTAGQTDIITKAAAASTRAARAGQTGLNTAFIPTNAWRDFKTAMINTETGLNPLDIAKGYAHSFRKDDIWQDYLASGASFSGYMESRQLPSTAKQLFRSDLENTIRGGPLEWIRRTGEVIEQGPRIGEFAKAKQQGTATPKAALQSRDVTVDFAKAGNAMKGYSQWVPYVNARLQGNVNVADSFRRKPLQSALTLGAYTMMPLVTTYLWNTTQFPEVWDDLQGFEKQRYFMWIYGDGKDENGKYTDILKVPKAEFEAIFSTPTENLLDYMRGADPEGLGVMATQILSDVSPLPFAREGDLSPGVFASGAFPTAVRAVGEPVGGTNWWTGRPLVPDRLKGAAPEEQYTERTPAALVKLGEFTGLSPLILQNFVRSQFGGLGEQVVDLASGDPGTAVGRVTGRASGAYGKAGETKQHESLDAAMLDYNTERVRRQRKSKALYDELKAVTAPAERQKILADGFKSGRITPEILKEVADLTAADRQNLSGVEKRLISAPVTVRAEQILTQMDGLTPMQRGQMMADYRVKKIITPAVQKELMRLSKQRARKPQE